ncbi:MAG TPA: tetratricopeptide repeat protein [Terriglobales bacterium]|nr:tetratricopeptide repeat protein [Terriglobales bacterium]
MRALRFLFIAAMSALIFSTGCSRSLLNRAQQFELQGKPGNALLVYREALAKTPERNSAKRAEILMRMGKCLYQMGRLSEAFSTFQKAAETDRNNNEANIRLGEMYLAAGAPERARELALLVLSRAATNVDAMTLFGTASLEVEQPGLAKQSYEQVLRSDPKRVDVAIALADIYNREDRIEKAREVLEHSAKALPGSPMALLALARLEEQQGNGSAAEGAYRRAVSVQDSPETNERLAEFLMRSARVTEAEQVLRRVDAQQPRTPVALGDFQLSSGRTSEALDQYLGAAERLNVSQAGKQNATKPTDNSGLLARVMEAEISDVAGADPRIRGPRLKLLRKRLESVRQQLDPATAAILESEVALADNNFVLAQVFSTAALDLAPESAAAHYISGCVESASGNDDRAVKEWEAALDIDQHYTPARLAIASKALSRGDAQQADLQARFAVRDDPGSIRGLLLFSRALLLQGKPTSAMVMAQRAGALNPNSVEALIVMGESALMQNRLPEALMAFQRAVVTHPDSDEAIDGLLRVYRRGTLSYSSLAKMEKVAAQPPVSSTLLEITGRLFAERGWYNEAIRSLQASVKADPSRATAARLLAQLQLSTGNVSAATAAASQPGGRSESLLNAYRAEQAGSRQQAIDYYERAIHDGDQTGVAANNLAWIYASQKQHLDRALELAGIAAKAMPNNPAVLDTMGYVLLQRREYSSAVKILETATRLASVSEVAVNPETLTQIRRHLADAYYSAGQTEAAFQLTQNRRFSALK